MTAFHTVKRIDNSRVIRRMGPERLREMARLVGLGALLATGALLYAWQHFEYLQLRYQVESIKAQKAQAAELNQELKLEVAGLRSPSRVDQIAHAQLGLTAPTAGQLAPFQAPAEPVLAEVRSTGSNRAQ